MAEAETGLRKWSILETASYYRALVPRALWRSMWLAHGEARQVGAGKNEKPLGDGRRQLLGGLREDDDGAIGHLTRRLSETERQLAALTQRHNDDIRDLDREARVHRRHSRRRRWPNPFRRIGAAFRVLLKGLE